CVPHTLTGRYRVLLIFVNVMNYISQIEEAKDYIIRKIDESDYPLGHPFKDERFRNDFHCHLLAVFMVIGKGKFIVDDLIEKKLSGNVSGKFDFNSFQEGLGEFNVLYYMFFGLMFSKDFPHIQLKDLFYEPNALVENKVLEFVFKATSNGEDCYVATEVKTIATAPEYREVKAIKSGNKVVKPYFKDVDLDVLKDREDYDSLIFLEQSTHSRQIAKNIKNINKKFEKKERVLNIGVIIFQYATSFDEMYAYLFHPTLGIYTRNPLHFENIDALVVFSMTPAPDPSLNDLYEKNHVQTICLTNELWKTDMLKCLRFDNYMFKNGKVVELVRPYIDEEFGVFTLELQHDVLFYINEKDDREAAIKLAETLNAKLPKLKERYIPRE
ncbi:hypothetical protein, partial [Vibrio parahaemolyticus]